jgi:hypothetical protein
MYNTREASLPYETSFLTAYAAPQLVFFELPKHVARNPDTLARLEAAVTEWDEARDADRNGGYTVVAAHIARSSVEERVAAILGIHQLCGLSPTHVREAVRRSREEQAASPPPPAHLHEMTPTERQSAAIGLLIARQIVDRECRQRNDARVAGFAAKIAEAIDAEVAEIGGST